MNTLEEALKYREKGISCLPCLPCSKETRVSWKKFQDAPLTIEDVRELFADHEGNIAILLGRPSSNLAVIDCEDKGLYREYKEEITRRHGDTCTVGSHRGGHIYIRTTKPIRGHTYEESDRKWELRGQTQFIVAPPSIHPDGTRYEFESHLDKIAIVESLPFCEFDYVESDDSEIVQAVYKNLDTNYDVESCLEVFETVSQNGKKYDTRSGFDYAVILTLVNRDVPFEMIHEAFKRTQTDTHYGRLIREKRGKEAETNLKFSYSKAITQTATNNPEYIELCEDVAHKVLRLRGAIHENASWWQGRGKLTDRDVLLSHVAKFESCKTTPWNLSERDGAELARCHHQSFNVSTHRLIRDKFLVRAVECNKLKSRASGYDFGPLLTNILNYPYTHSKYVSIWLNKNNRSVETYGVFERKVLGKAAEQIYFTLLIYGPLTQKELTEKTGVSQGAVSKKCQELELYSLIMKIGRHYHADPHYNFKRLSDDAGAAEIQEKRKLSHEADRKRHQEILQWRNQHIRNHHHSLSDE